MSTVEERFDKVVQNIESVLAAMGFMKELGIYGKDEFSAGIVMLSTLERAMTVLDPERAREYVKGEMEKAIVASGGSLDSLLNGLDKMSGGNQAGPYL